MLDVGLIVPPDQPPSRFLPAARAAEAAGLDDVWLWEDCFAESGVAAAGSVLAATERIRVGIGLMPVPLRAVALAAMELATLEGMHPGRVLPGIGHGVLDWMGQAGVRTPSPMTLLREHAVALRALLAGETVTSEGRTVRLDDVRLRWAPETPPPLLVGGIGPRTLALAGELGDGVILTGGTDAAGVGQATRIVREARAAAGASGDPMVVVFASLPVGASAQHLADEIGALGEAGATRVPVCLVEPSGEPVGDERILAGAARIAEARTLLGRD